MTDSTLLFDFLNSPSSIPWHILGFDEGQYVTLENCLELKRNLTIVVVLGFKELQEWWILYFSMLNKM